MKQVKQEPQYAVRLNLSIEKLRGFWANGPVASKKNAKFSAGLGVFVAATQHDAFCNIVNELPMSTSGIADLPPI
jgi:hypothetical protein